MSKKDEVRATSTWLDLEKTVRGERVSDLAHMAAGAMGTIDALLDLLEAAEKKNQPPVQEG